MYTSDGADVEYNKFNINTSFPPENPHLWYPNSEYSCVVATTNYWKLSKCTDKHHVVCQSGQCSFVYVINTVIEILMLKYCSRGYGGNGPTLQWIFIPCISLIGWPFTAVVCGNDNLLTGYVVNLIKFV